MLVNFTELIKLFSRKGRKFYFFIARTAGYLPRSTYHFHKSFIHKSVSGRDAKCDGDSNNERLEFLGDAVIETVVSEVLYNRFPQANEGFMSQLRSNMVCRARLNEVSFELGLDEYIVLSSRRDLNISHIPGDVLEAFVAAIYLDGGMAKARRFVIKNIASPHRIEKALGDSQQANYKSNLVSLGEQSGVEVFFETHRVAERQTLDDGTEVNFASEVKICGISAGQGFGRSKKQAEQAAARQAVEALDSGRMTFEGLRQQAEAPACDNICPDEQPAPDVIDIVNTSVASRSLSDTIAPHAEEAYPFRAEWVPTRRLFDIPVPEKLKIAQEAAPEEGAPHMQMPRG